MVARYTAVLKPYQALLQGSIRYPDLAIATVLKAIRAEHAAHLAQLKSRLVEPVGVTPAPSRSPRVLVAGPRAAALTALEQAEETASDRLIGQLAGLPPSLAQLFASIAASEATHVPYLQAARHVR